MKNGHLPLMKEFFYHQPYGKRELYKQRVETATLEKLTKHPCHGFAITNKDLPILEASVSP